MENSTSILGADNCFTLTTGAKIPAVGLGTWQATNGDGKLAVFAALEAGYRHIDCAHLYGNEVEVGEALAEAFAGGVSGLKREDVFITSKLWCTTSAPKRIGNACERSLKNLGVSYLDLFLLHWPVVAPMGDATDPPRKSSGEDRRSLPSVQATWHAMEDLVKRGLTKAIGLSNFSIHQIQDVLTYATIKPAVNQVELHPYWRQDELVGYCKDNGIHVTAHTPLGIPGVTSEYGSGSEAGSPRPRSARTSSGRSSPGLSDSPSGTFASALLRSKSKSVHGPMLKNSNIADIAERTGKTPAQVILRWAVQRGVSVLPRSIRPERISSNLEVLNWELSQDDWEKVNSLEPQVRLIDGTHSYLSEYGPFRTIDETDNTDDENHASSDDSSASDFPSHRRRFSGALEEIGEDVDDASTREP
eukprot:TRINITY_DN61_c0_g1_i1.p1 TRINITY_DN61_c0_g1~~TRINITY_DN61_c0_g1_i1.p1  ORF type:complete len:417 (+),score=64.81 TRINITY_DN61_c0_g1_i1:210-1460(+)